jgi:hypothetical protein
VAALLRHANVHLGQITLTDSRSGWLVFPDWAAAISAPRGSVTHIVFRLPSSTRRWTMVSWRRTQPAPPPAGTHFRPRSRSRGRTASFSTTRSAAFADPTPEHYRPLVLFLGYTSLRWGEASALRVGDVDILRRRVHMSRSVAEVNGRLDYSTTKMQRLAVGPVSAVPLYRPRSHGRSPT